MISVATLFLSLTGFAQVCKGKWLVGGGFDSFTRTNTMTSPAAENKNSSVSISPRVGYFFADRWAVGIAPNYSNYKYKDSIVTNKGSGYGIGAFVRYYQPIGEKLGIFGQLNGISYSVGSSELDHIDDAQSRKNKYQSVGVGAFIQPGIVYFITPKIGLETSIGALNLGYSSSKGEDEAMALGQEVKQSGFATGLNFNYQFNLAALFYLGK
jgi:hypothetical protein